MNTLLIKSADFVTSVTEQHCEFKLSESESHEVTCTTPMWSCVRVCVRAVVG